MDYGAAIGAGELSLFGINEDIWGPAEVSAGTYIVMGVVALMVLRAAPAFLREVLPAFQLYPVFAGGIAFWWLAFTGRPVLGFLAMVVGILAMRLFQLPAKDRAPRDASREK